MERKFKRLLSLLIVVFMVVSMLPTTVFADLLSANDLCLEEYLKLLSTNYSYEGEHLKFTGDNTKTYEVYYVAKTGAQTEVFVPEGYSYTVSGDNMNGFIVTVCLDK